MALFLDAADPEHIAEAMALGIYAGVTTNPKLLAERPREDPYDQLARIARACPGSIYMQVHMGPLDEMEDEALTLREIAPGRTVIKVPMSADGLALCERLRAPGVPVCLTAAFNPSQAFAAGAAGAHAVALYVGRIEKRDGDGVGTVRRSAAALAAAGYHTRVLAASIGDEKVLESLIDIVGIDFTVPWAIHQQLLHHPGTEEAISAFREAEAVFGEV